MLARIGQLLGQSDDSRHIFIACFAFHIFAARPTAMRDDPYIAFLLEGDRVHQSAACLQTVARVDVDMFAGQAVWTVIRESITCDSGVALFADKIFNGAGEFFRGHAFFEKSSLTSLGITTMLACFFTLSSRAKSRDLF